MRFLSVLLFSFLGCNAFAQPSTNSFFQKDSLIVVTKQPNKGFYHEYIIFIPKGTPLNATSVLLVEPNNTGKITDSIEIHKEAAIALASVSSVGNNCATELKIPLLVPVFPRPASQPLLYTHALDRDVLLNQTPEYKRLDLQLLEMINDAKNRLASLEIEIAPKFFMCGFSASGTFVNRFSLMHPEKIKALAIGGFNGKLMLPLEALNGEELNYPIGIKDFSKLFDKNFDFTNFKEIPKHIYMGALDTNDAVQFDDAYSGSERKIINENLGKSVQERFVNCQNYYQKQGIVATFKTFEKVGHWTTSEMNLEVILFFLNELKK
ncbi:hypothetical protein [Flavobacterium orientale]|uniref:Alpha/beta hydrolase n=1 Tax=Flavobacterium orientale TaxID=1756020 RepID=A0A917DAZ8_9FLAO|nr:hypothetical protein [Flavobacterium orientale]GGD24581.1 hypothetical protein GCM10011343_13460 [Flavobacterium orientale]